MSEVFPVLAGVALGLVVSRVLSKRYQLFLLIFFSLVFGVAASWLSGELATSLVYVVIDAGQVLVAAVLTVALAKAWRRQTSHPVHP